MHSFKFHHPAATPSPAGRLKTTICALLPPESGQVTMKTLLEPRPHEEPISSIRPWMVCKRLALHGFRLGVCCRHEHIKQVPQEWRCQGRLKANMSTTADGECYWNAGPKELASPAQTGVGHAKQGAGQSSSGSGLATSSAVSDTEPDSPQPQAPTLRTPGRIPRDLMRSFRSRPRSHTSPRQHGASHPSPAPPPSRHQRRSQAMSPPHPAPEHAAAPRAVQAQAYAPQLTHQVANVQPFQAPTQQQQQQQEASDDPNAPDGEVAASQPMASWQLAQGVAERSSVQADPNRLPPQQRRGSTLGPASPSAGGWGASVMLRNATSSAKPVAEAQTTAAAPSRASHGRKPHARLARHQPPKQAEAEDPASSSSEQSSGQQAGRGKLSIEDFKSMYKRKAYEEGPSASARKPGLSMRLHPEPESASDCEQPLPEPAVILPARLETPKWLSEPTMAAPAPSMAYFEAQSARPAGADDSCAMAASAANTATPSGVGREPHAAVLRTPASHRAFEQGGPTGDSSSPAYLAWNQADPPGGSPQLPAASARSRALLGMHMPEPGEGIFAAHTPAPTSHFPRGPIIRKPQPLLAATRWLPNLGEGIFAPHQAPAQAHLQRDWSAEDSGDLAAWQRLAALTPSQLLQADAGIFASHEIPLQPVVVRTPTPDSQQVSLGAATTIHPTQDVPPLIHEFVVRDDFRGAAVALPDQAGLIAVIGPDGGGIGSRHGAEIVQAASTPHAAGQGLRDEPGRLQQDEVAGRQVSDIVAGATRIAARMPLELPEERASIHAVANPLNISRSAAAMAQPAEVLDEAQQADAAAAQEDLYEEPPTPRLFEFVDPRVGYY